MSADILARARALAQVLTQTCNHEAGLHHTDLQSIGLRHWKELLTHWKHLQLGLTKSAAWFGSRKPVEEEGQARRDHL